MPGYEAMRHDAASGALGTLDHLTVNWLYALGLIQFGPFNNWILGSEGNLLYELGSHLAAFATDLLGPLDDVAAVASHPIELPGNQRVYRHWNAVGRSGSTSMSLNLSVAPGQPDRSVHLRGSAAVARLDFERDLYWRERANSNSAMFDPLHTARSMARTIAGQGWRNVGRQLASTFARTPYNGAFQASISNSVAAYYRTFAEGLDPRLQGSFGAEVIRLCERIVAAAGAEPASPPKPIRVREGAPLAPPRVLVIGGTGFIGKRLVEALVKRGVGVRVMSRSLVAARIALDGLPVEIVQGSHDDPAALDTALRGIDVVYHLAKATGQRWEDYLRDDVEPTRVLAEAVLAHGVKRFVYTGTIDSYDSADARTVIDARTPVDARIARRNLYARSKAACEALLQRMHAERGLPLVIFRPGVVIGAGSPPAHWGVGMFHSDTRAQLWGQGTTKLPLVLVDDVAEGLALALDAPGIEGRTFLLTDEPLLSAREYVERGCRGERHAHRRDADADLAFLRARPGQGGREAPRPPSEPARAELPRLGLPRPSRALRQQRHPRRSRLAAGGHARGDGAGTVSCPRSVTISANGCGDPRGWIGQRRPWTGRRRGRGGCGRGCLSSQSIPQGQSHVHSPRDPGAREGGRVGDALRIARLGRGR